MNKNSNSKLTVKDYVEILSNEEELIKFLNQHEVCDAIAIKGPGSSGNDYNHES